VAIARAHIQSCLRREGALAARRGVNTARKAKSQCDAVRHERGLAMTITSRELLDTSIAQLQTLAASLRDQLSESGDGTEAVSLEARACKEIQRSLSVLISKLQATRCVSSAG
jgi:hypothetical protein